MREGERYEDTRILRYYDIRILGYWDTAILRYWDIGKSVILCIG